MTRFSLRTVARLAGAAGLAVAMGAAPALAQQAKPATPAAPAAPAAPQISPTHLAIAAEVVKLTGLGRSFDYVVPQFSEQMKQMFGPTRPEIASDLAATLEALKPEFEAQKAEMVNATNRIVASALSEADLKEVAAFMKTPAGQNYVAAQPKIVDALFGEAQTWSRKLSDYMLTRVRTELKKKNIDI